VGVVIGESGMTGGVLENVGGADTRDKIRGE